MRSGIAVILGMSPTGLAVARCLGREKLYVVTIDYDCLGKTLWSRFAEKYILPDFVTSREIIDILLNIGENFHQKPVLFTDRDEYVFLISNHREALEKFYFICLPENSLVSLINNKMELINYANAHGLSTPLSLVFEGGKITQNIKEWLHYPAIIKPLYGRLAATIAGFKTIVVRNDEELEYASLNVCREKIPFLLQEMIPGDDDEVIGIGVYLNRQSIPLGVSSFRKIYQNPKGHGRGVLAKSESLAGLEGQALSFLQKCKYSGLAEIEFKRDTRNGVYKLIEINTRPWSQIELATRCDCNLALIAYNDLSGSKIDHTPKCARDKNIYWVSELPYLSYFIKYGLWRTKPNFPLKKFFTLFMKRKFCFAVFAWKDPKPFVLYFFYYLLKFFK